MSMSPSEPMPDSKSQKPALPVVTSETHDHLVRELSVNPEVDPVVKGIERMKEENPVLLGILSEYVDDAGKSDDEKYRLIVPITTTYDLLRSQAEADSIRESINGE